MIFLVVGLWKHSTDDNTSHRHRTRAHSLTFLASGSEISDGTENTVVSGKDLVRKGHWKSRPKEVRLFALTGFTPLQPGPPPTVVYSKQDTSDSSKRWKMQAQLLPNGNLYVTVKQAFGTAKPVEPREYTRD